MQKQHMFGSCNVIISCKYPSAFFILNLSYIALRAFGSDYDFRMTMKLSAPEPKNIVIIGTTLDTHNMSLFLTLAWKEVVLLAVLQHTF